MRLVQFRLNEVMALSPFFNASGPWPKHGPHHDSRISAPAARKTSASDSPPSRGSVFSMSRFTPPEPGNTMNSFTARDVPFARAARRTSAASRRSPYPPFVHEPMNALSKPRRSRATSVAGNAFAGLNGFAMSGTTSERSSVSSISYRASAPGANRGYGSSVAPFSRYHAYVSSSG